MVRIARIFKRCSFFFSPLPSSRTKNTGCPVISPILPSLPLQFFFVPAMCTPRVFGRGSSAQGTKTFGLKSDVGGHFLPRRFARDYVIILAASRTFPFEPRNEFFAAIFRRYFRRWTVTRAAEIHLLICMVNLPTAA